MQRALLFVPPLGAVAIYALTFSELQASLAIFGLVHLLAMGMFFIAFATGAVTWGKEARDLRAWLPGWRWPVSVVVLVFSAINFVIFGFTHETALGQPPPADPATSALIEVVSNHGATVRWLTPAEKAAEDRVELRGFAGHWIAFMGVSALILDAALVRRRSSGGPGA